MVALWVGFSIVEYQRLGLGYQTPVPNRGLVGPSCPRHAYCADDWATTCTGCQRISKVQGSYNGTTAQRQRSRQDNYVLPGLGLGLVLGLGLGSVCIAWAGDLPRSLR